MYKACLPSSCLPLHECMETRAIEELLLGEIEREIYRVGNRWKEQVNAIVAAMRGATKNVLFKTLTNK